ncbi:hypothetical protein [Paracoccus aerodenitrificans]|uniref:hypothetical protein n=1 Tax=Paracoccus aerodenitrificans TaxID=3017781 RepID=UPI0022F09D6C|nr:hypothetical protein [Paracoccus aerodenitrificans]WBU64013.1 hypothetical protein PAE61_17055 [Paracoccus aerodenitrificans]
MPDWRRGEGDAGGRAMMIGAGLTALWVVMLLIFWLTAGSGSGPGWWVSAVAALTPLGLIWIAVGLARAVDELRNEAQALRSSIDHNILRSDPPRIQQPSGSDGMASQASSMRPSVATGKVPARRAEPASPQDDPRQSSLGLDAPEPIELAGQTVIRALNFPDGPDDREAVEALREALRDPDLARLIRSAQDVITLLAERGIYTEDLDSDAIDPSAWRRFGDGQRGQAVSAVGSVRDPDLLEAATLAMRGDEIFRDAVHHFLRLFDRGATAMIPRLSDDEIVWLAETRSARTFMLLGRAAGLFGQEE